MDNPKQMSKRNYLALLVNSLTKGEKRYFRMYSALQEGSKDYLFLFEILEKNTAPETAKLSFNKLRPEASYDVTAKYLYKVITDSLVHIRMDQHPSAKLSIALLKVNILFEKSLYDQGFKQLKKIQTSAHIHEQSLIHLAAAKLELYYLSNLQFNNITESELILKQMKMEELLKQERHIIQHTALYELLRHRLLYKGAARTEKQKEELNDLVVSELNITSGAFAETFESHKIHLLFQANYFITVNDYQSALKTFYDLNDLFEENEHLWINSPLDYLSFIEGILDSLHTIRQHHEMDFFLKKLQKIQDLSGYLNVLVQRLSFIYKVAAFVSKGDFEQAAALKEHFDEVLFKKIHLLDLNKQAEVYLYTALIYVGSGKMNRAHFYLNRILMESKLYYNLPVYRTFRLIHLLVQFELGNDEYIAYETRSLKRSFSQHIRKSYLLEKIVFSFVQQSIPPTQNERVLQWNKFHKKFGLIEFDKFEIQILKIFDFSAWIQAKLLKQSFSLILQENYSRHLL